jgi:primosomal protein N' (replication factor Y) (superfamily II helicase)
VARPLLSLDRPFTYELSRDLGAGVGSLVRVRFHGKLVRGWVLGPTGDMPERILPVHDRVSPVRFFDERRLELFRWLSTRYVAPLASVIERSSPPRVASEDQRTSSAASSPTRHAPSELSELPRPYVHADLLEEALAGGAGTFVVRPAPGDDAALAVACVARTLAGARTAIVVVPEIDPEPATVRALRDAFGDDVAAFFGGDKRARYRMWLEIAGGRFRVVIGTRSAVFAPLEALGLLYVAREQHSLHREERSPSYHARDVAIARADIDGAVAVLASAMPSLEAQASVHTGVHPAHRAWPPVELAKPGPEGRAPRLVRALREARRAFVYEPFRGYGVARVCRSCSEPASCASCGGVLRSEAGEIRCVVCEAPGRCANCGAVDFGLARGGAERVEEWVRGVASVPVARIGDGAGARPPGDAEILVGGLDTVKDVGAVGADLVAILGADAALRRPGVGARDAALGAWAEVVSWVGPGGRAIVQTNQPNDHAVQALVAGSPERFARIEAPRLAAAGFPVGAPVFRVVGTPALGEELSRLPHITLLVSELEGATVCLATLPSDAVEAWGTAIRALAVRGIVTRVEAEPHL